MITETTNRQTGIELLSWVRSVSDMLISDFPAEKATFQPSPTDNHVLWVLGHLAATDLWIAGVLGIPDMPVPESYGKLFGGGTSPVAPAGAYPPFAEVRQSFTNARKALLKWYAAAPESQFQIDLSTLSKGFTTDPLDGLFKLAWHEGWHFGQVASVRKALGLPNKLG